jgi:hypothetical protein
MPTQDGIGYAIDFQIDSLMIVSSNGEAVDLRQVMGELNLYEDLFGNAMTGSLLINDTQNLINVLPIIGVEYLHVVLIKPSTPWKISKTFRVYKITDRRKHSPNSEDYVLHFCSEELILDQALKISKSYKGMTISSIIKDITTNYLKIDSAKFPITSLTGTVGNFDVVIPYWSPFKAINWLSRMGRTGKSTGCSFVFFEDGQGFHFDSLENLSQQQPLQEINFSPMNLAGFTGEKNDKSDTQIRLESAEEFDLSQAPDLLRSISSGLYSSKLIRVNPISQQVKTDVQNGIDFFDKTKHGNKNPFLQTGQDRTNVILPKHHDAFYRVTVDNLNAETWVLQRNAYLSAMHGFQVKVSIPGNMNFRVGRMVQMNLPAATVGRKDEKTLDSLFTGNYMITAIRHKVDRAKYACILELSKDSLQVHLPAPLEGNAGMKKLRKS